MLFFVAMLMLLQSPFPSFVRRGGTQSLLVCFDSDPFWSLCWIFSEPDWRHRRWMLKMKSIYILAKHQQPSQVGCKKYLETFERRWAPVEQFNSGVWALPLLLCGSLSRRTITRFTGVSGPFLTSCPFWPFLAACLIMNNLARSSSRWW